MGDNPPVRFFQKHLFIFKELDFTKKSSFLLNFPSFMNEFTARLGAVSELTYSITTTENYSIR